MDGTGHGRGLGARALCQLINESCRHDPRCPAMRNGQPCWRTADVSCCARNDKSRCCYCSIFLAYLDDGPAIGLLPLAMKSEEDVRFARLCRAEHHHAQRHGRSEVSPPPEPPATLP